MVDVQSGQESTILRALRARYAAEARAADMEVLQRALAHAKSQPGGDNGRTDNGRRAKGLQDVIELLQAHGRSTWASGAGEEFSSLLASTDALTIYLGELVPEADEEEDTAPIRLVVDDGADSTTAAAYLSEDEAEQVGRDLIAAARHVRKVRAKRARTSG